MLTLFFPIPPLISLPSLLPLGYIAAITRSYYIQRVHV
jgi:hypothetical protein